MFNHLREHMNGFGLDFDSDVHFFCMLESIEQSSISSEPVANARGILYYLHYIYITLL
jgi:hypothetical protein